MFGFSEIIGQQKACRRLQEEVMEGRVPHARLISGPPGSGTLALALAYARLLSCPHRKDGEACGHCPSCVKWDKLVHPDVHFAFPIVNRGKSSKPPVCADFLPQWRARLISSPYFYIDHWLDDMGADNKQAQIFTQESDEIIRRLNLKSSEGGYKTTLIWLPERMHVSCANKLLKLLEEPPELTVFLLVSEDPEQLLPTILSRVQRLSVPRIADDDLAQALEERYGVQPSDSRTIAHMAAGDMVRALETIHLSEDQTLFFDLFTSIMRLAYQRHVREIKQWSEQVAAIGRERQKAFLTYCQRMTRESFVRNLRCDRLNFMNDAETAFTARFAPFVNERNVGGIMDELGLAQDHIEQNVNARMVFFDLGLKLIMLIKS